MKRSGGEIWTQELRDGCRSQAIWGFFKVNWRIFKSFLNFTESHLSSGSCEMAPCQWQPVSVAPGDLFSIVIFVVSFVLFSFLLFIKSKKVNLEYNQPEVMFFTVFSSTCVSTHSMGPEPQYHPSCHQEGSADCPEEVGPQWWRSRPSPGWFGGDVMAAEWRLKLGWRGGHL